MEISKTDGDAFGQGRALQKWSDDPLDVPLESSDWGDAKTSSGAWDQFAANEAKFGIKSNYEETLYTTKLDRSSKDFRERERKADQLAKEIMGVSQAQKDIAAQRTFLLRTMVASRPPRPTSMWRKSATCRPMQTVQQRRIGER